MVDLFSGDFNYNIPLMDVEGYPINISYHSGISMDQEASWVGLGWNINPGVINRNMRGLPDDMDGENINKDFNIKKNETYGGSLGAGLQLFGLEFVRLGASLGVFYNNYRGVGFEYSLTPSVSMNVANKTSLTVGLGLSGNSQSGLTYAPSLGLSREMGDKDPNNGTGKTGSLGISVGASINSRLGLQAFTYGFSASYQNTSQKVDKNGNADGLKNQDLGFNGNSSITFGTQTYQPEVSMPLSTYSLSLSTTVGGELYGVHGNVSLSGYYTAQDLVTKHSSKPGYGYIYSQDALTNGDDVLLDYNREKDLPYGETTPNLPVTNFTYDVFNVSGQGIGGVYRPHRSDVGIVHEDHMTGSSNSDRFGAEFGIADLVHGGYNADVNHSSVESGIWHQGAISALDFKFADYDHNPLDEPVYFKNAGEKSVVDADYINNLWGDQPKRLALPAADYLTSFVENDGTGALPLQSASAYKRSKREKRNQTITTLTADQGAFTLDGDIRTIPINATLSPTDTILPNDHIDRTAPGSYRQPKHISEITALNPDGMRYVYGIPVYNTYQAEATFAVANQSPNTGTVTYDYADATISNTKGIDNYFNRSETPPYAHSYLLTAVLSPDYVDLGQDGITDDDLGTATKINYSMVTASYPWRTPYNYLSANYNEGYKSDVTDAKGSYVWGMKELWYVNSIESKNYIAEFHISPRYDGLGAYYEFGGINRNAQQYQLDYITLYSKQDRIRNGNNATPIKTVHFVYDYSLCQNVQNNDNPMAGQKGKLTLTRIYFTYGKSSQKGVLSPYEFHYDGLNPGYDIKAYDRWGNYKPVTDGGWEFPYTPQDNRSTKGDPYSSAWSLTKIDLPSGGSINVTYEADDYAYVQDKPAMQMFKIIGFGNSSTYNPGSQLYNGSNENNYVFFKLASNITGSDASDQVYRNYIRYLQSDNTQVKDFYYTCLTDIDGKGHKEYVRGYAQMDDNDPTLPYGVAAGRSDIGYIRLKRESSGDKRPWDPTINPISKAGFQFARLQTPRLVYPGYSADGSPVSGIKGLAGIFMDITSFIDGINNFLRSKSYCRYADLDYSWIRLDCPTKKKIGGGTRVKQIAMSDNWSVMGAANTGASDFSYGQTYDYTTTETIDGVTSTISSGVASYEPTIGNDENPWRLPIRYTMKHKGTVDDEMYAETPYGESFFPGPSVGYSRVKVANLAHAGVSKNATGYTVSTFYTAKDFPTIVKETSPSRQDQRSGWLFRLLGIDIKHHAAASQGYFVELNDMHGKPRAQYVFDEGVTDPTKYRSGVEYYYNEDQSYNNGDPSKPHHLSNQVKVIYPDGTTGDATVGEEIDAVADMRQHSSNSWGAGMQYNGESFIIPAFIIPVPIVLPIIIPSYSSEHTTFNEAVFTKVMNRYGILQRTVAYEDGASVQTENRAYDSETGEVLLTKTKNEYHDDIYNLTYPAHWVYDGMGPAYKNIGAYLKNVQVTDEDSIILSSGENPATYFVPGDEVLVKTATYGIPFHLWVHKTDFGGLIFIDQYGNDIGPFTSDIQIMRSGRRNMQGIPIGTVTCMNDPIASGSISLSTSSKVINASATEFSDHWNNECDYGQMEHCDFNHAARDIRHLLNYYADHHRLIAGLAEPLSGVTAFQTATSFKKQGLLPHATRDTMLEYVDPSNPDQSVMEIRFKPVTDDSLICPLTVHASLGFNFDSIASFGYIESQNYQNTPVPVVVTMRDGSHITLSFRDDDCPYHPDCSTYCSLIKGRIVNPYRTGLRGDWRRKRSLVYLDNRTYSGPLTQRKDGIYNSFDPYWHPGTKWSSSTNSNWTWTSEVTKYSRNGMEIENKDALNRYSAAVYGYNYSLPIAVSSNAQLRDIAYDGFENYGHSYVSLCPNVHFKFDDAHYSNLDGSVKHTGKFSLKIAAAGDQSTSRPIYYSELDSAYRDTLTYPFISKPGTCIGLFSPDTGKYVFSAWVKQDTSGYAKSYTTPYAEIDISIPGPSIATYICRASGPIIEGWQRIESTFTVPSGSSNITVILKASPSSTTWYDDVRMFPFRSNLKTYAYDEVTLKLLGELDENNYATIYEYDQQGMLARVKKETVKGIMTVKESRNSTFKKP
jgi:hypothetical protein